MILKGAQRGGARQLAAHLLKDENEHIEVMELRGFVAGDLHGALDEAHAIARGTKCRQFLFSLSLNPPEDTVLRPEVFAAVADAVEERLGLTNQPRAIVVHEKEGRRHAHAVWSRIDPETMTAKQLSFYKNRLTELSREAYLEHGWELPDGLRDPLLKDPTNFTRAEWQQALRTERDPREIKQVFQTAWERSDGKKAFAAVLRQRGFVVARGDRRGFVAIDHEGQVYSLSRWTGVTTRELKARLGDPKELPGVEDAKAQLRAALSPRLQSYREDLKAAHAAERSAFRDEKNEMKARHRTARASLKLKQQRREQAETRKRAERLRGGIRGLWDKLTGRARDIRDRNRMEAWECLKRDRGERDALIATQTDERRRLQQEIVAMRERHRNERRALDREIGRALGLKEQREYKDKQAGLTRGRERDRTRGPER